MAISALFPRWVPRLYFGQRGDFGCDKGWFDGFRASFAQVRWYPRQNAKNPALSLTWGFTARGSGSRVRNDSKAALGALRPSRGVSQSHPVGDLTASLRANRQTQRAWRIV